MNLCLDHNFDPCLGEAYYTGLFISDTCAIANNPEFRLEKQFEWSYIRYCNNTSAFTMASHRNLLDPLQLYSKVIDKGHN